MAELLTQQFIVLLIFFIKAGLMFGAGAAISMVIYSIVSLVQELK